MSISEKIKAIRKARGITPTIMARELGIEATNYPRLENRGNRLTYENLEAISKALGMNVIEMLTWGEGIKDTEIRPEEIKRLEKDISRAEELLEYQRDRIKFFKHVIGRFIIEEAWGQFINSIPDPLAASENETGNLEWINKKEQWDNFLTTHIFVSTSYWKLYESGLLDNKILKEIEEGQDFPVPFDVRMKQAKLNKEADRVFGKAEDK